MVEGVAVTVVASNGATQVVFVQTYEGVGAIAILLIVITLDPGVPVHALNDGSLEVVGPADAVGVKAVAGQPVSGVSPNGSVFIT